MFFENILYLVHLKVNLLCINLLKVILDLMDRLVTLKIEYINYQQCPTDQCLLGCKYA